MIFPFSFWRSSGSAFPDASLPAYWSMEEASGSRADASGSGNTLSETGSVGSDAGKKLDGAYFDGTGGFLATYLGNTRLWFSEEWTISAWLKLDSDAAPMAAVAKYGFGSGPGGSFLDQLMLTYESDTGQFRLYFTDGAGGPFTLVYAATFGTVTTGVFYHVAIGRRGGDIFISVNRVEDTAAFTDTMSENNATPFTIGGTYNTVSLAWNGTIDEVAVWRRALSGTELDDIYNSGAGRFYGDAGFPAMP